MIREVATLPGELVIAASRKCDQGSLFNLLRGSKFWHDLVLPVLYAHLEVRAVKIHTCTSRKSRYLDGSIPEGSSTAIPQLYNIVLRLLRDPGLISYVRRVKAKPTKTIINFSSRNQVPPEYSDLSIYSIPHPMAKDPLSSSNLITKRSDGI